MKYIKLFESYYDKVENNNENTNGKKSLEEMLNDIYRNPKVFKKVCKELKNKFTGYINTDYGSSDTSYLHKIIPNYKGLGWTICVKPGNTMKEKRYISIKSMELICKDMEEIIKQEIFNLVNTSKVMKKINQ